MKPISRQSAFTMIELVLVVAVSAILMLGISALVEVPRRVAEEQDNEAATAATAGAVIQRLDRDVRYATDVRLVSAREVEIDLPSGETITYSWAGTASDPLMRDDGVQNVELLSQIGRVTFVIDKSRRAYRSDGEGTVANTAVTVGSFQTFSLNAGYSLLPLGLLTLVTEILGHTEISDTKRAGIVVKTSGLGAAASFTSLTARLRRHGTRDLRVEVRLAHPTQSMPLPGEGSLIATGHVANGSLPTTTSDVVIPLTSVRKATNNTRYFVELAADGTSYAADVEHRFLSIAAAATSVVSGFVRSTDGGNSYNPLTSLLHAGQTRFTLVAEDAATAAPSDAGVKFEMIPTSVRMKLTLLTSSGTKDIGVSFPIVNNLARLNQ